MVNQYNRYNSSALFIWYRGDDSIIVHKQDEEDEHWIEDVNLNTMSDIHNMY